MEPLNTFQTIFSLFYAIMWGTLANVWPRWRAFDLTLTAFPEERASQRWALSFLFLNAVPIAFFVLILFLLSGWTARLDWSTAGKMIIVLLQPFALTGFYWIWVSILQRYRRAFYPSELNERRYPSLRLDEDLDPNRAPRNLVFGLLYIGVPLAALGVVRCALGP